MLNIYIIYFILYILTIIYIYFNNKVYMLSLNTLILKIMSSVEKLLQWKHKLWLKELCAFDRIITLKINFSEGWFNLLWMV